MNNIKVSIVVPVYNTEQYLAEALESILVQTMQDFEVICVDDGSDDRSMEILEGYAAADERFHIISQDHAGAGVARNKGLAAAKGEFVYFFDSDDLCKPELLEKTVKRAEETDADIVAFEFHRFYPDGHLVKGVGVHTEWLPEGIEVFSYRDCPNRIMNVVNPTPWNKLYRRSFVEENHLHYEEISSTNDVTFAAVSVAAAERIAILKEDLFSYRIGITGTITANKQKSLDNVTIAVTSGVRQAMQMPHHEEIDKAITYFSMEIFCASFYRYVTDINLPSVKTYYNNMRQFFFQKRFNDLRPEDIANERLYHRYRIIKKHKYSKIRNLYNKRLIVSLTSYPARIGGVGAVLETIYKQVRPADEVVLWLAEEQFPSGEEGLPEDLRQFIAEGCLTLKWCDDLKPHKKYFYAFQEYPDDVIVTIDDDLLYDAHLLERLFDTYLLYPEAVSAGRVHLMLTDTDGTVLPYDSWIKDTDADILEPSMQLFATGVGGVLYPPHLFDKKMLDKEAVKSTCLFADDIWLKAMELLADVPVVLAQHRQALKYVPGSQEDSLWSDNLSGRNDEQMELIIAWLSEHYEEGIFSKKLMSSKNSIDLTGMREISRHLQLERERAEKKYRDVNHRRIVSEQKWRTVERSLKGFISARVDIKAVGSEENMPQILKTAGRNVRVSEPSWVTDQTGHGRVVMADAAEADGSVGLRIRCIGDGVMKFTLRGMDVRDAGNKRIPYWLDYTDFEINGEKIINEPKMIAHDMPWRYFREVRNGEVLAIRIAWKSHAVGKIPDSLEDLRRELKQKEDDFKGKLRLAEAEKSETAAKLQLAYAEKSEINAKLQRTYAEKSELNAKLQKTYAEKSEINAKLKQAYADKTERGLKIKELEARIAELERSLPGERTYISWGGYNYFRDNHKKIREEIRISYVYAKKETVMVSDYELIDKEDILKIKNPFVIISQALEGDIAAAAKWLKQKGVPFTHLSFILKGREIDGNYIKALGGLFTDENQNTFSVSPQAGGRICIHAEGVKNTSVQIGAVHVSGLLDISLTGSSSKLQIGDGTVFEDADIVVEADGTVQIGKDCRFAKAVQILQTEECMIFDMFTGKRIDGPVSVSIGNRVQIGCEALLLSGAELGDDSVVESYAVCTDKFPADSVITGNPAVNVLVSV